ncbi:CRAL/TRIO domain-containing protein [Eremomyces bilateralis CBS 781.70]|uniref:CRAL/TRIO domain-containing protein n=1 Tax=Eremomyces bilateralis CBS 781.70 TaxID=1392243 RepID=A0A6G1FZU3_9PEZI|nr:CRAL/TRIO domain-containing protein [Eremomyces bilateralis CBS 781.70]KAF1811190.1 CRAL/TRIO domain-containing protein [Eremomyces bilateralis CBS 781.70]
MAESSSSLSRVDSFQYPAAHLGHLTDSQQMSLDEFKSICEKAGYYKPSTGAPYSYASHDDETMLRYLRARKFVPSEAVKQFKDTEDWRKANHLKDLYDTIDTQEYEQTRRLYPQWTGRRDKRGIPVYLFEVAHLDSKTVSEYEKSVTMSTTVPHNEAKVPTKMLRLFALYENLTRFIMPLCTSLEDRPHLETPISQSSNIVDISKVGLRTFWNLKNHMQDASQLATAHYPETLDRIFIIGAPVFFPTVWSWIKRWFDPITVSKIFILGPSEVKPTLEKFIDIANIPKKYGGELDFEFGMLPVLEPSIKEHLQWQSPHIQGGQKTFPIGPIIWREAPGDHMEAIAVGSEGRKRREQVVARVKADFKGMHGVSRLNTEIDWSQEPAIPSTGTNTQPTEDGDLYYGSDLAPERANTPAEVDGGGAATAAAVEADTQQNGEAAESGADADATRTGTSVTKQGQQTGTHAEGQLAEGTPQNVSHDVGGDKAAVMEPKTVGQAPKTVPVPDPVEETPGVVGKAKAAAGAVGGAIENTVGALEEKVGLTGKEEKKEEVLAERPKDPRVNELENGKVEEFIRSRNASETPKAP